MRRITISIATITLLSAISGCADTGSRHDKNGDGDTASTGSGSTGNTNSSDNTGNGNGNGTNLGATGVTVSAVTPNTGLPGGGTLVTISGSGFKNGAVVFFGNNTSPDVQVKNEGELTALTPPGNPGVVDVDVVNTDNTFGKLNNAFTYDPNANNTPGTNPGNQVYARVADYGEPTPADQELLELINEARKDPPAAGTKLGLDLSGIPAKPPLSHNRVLGELSHAHSKNMATKGVFDHVVDNVGPNGRILSSTYDLNTEYGTNPLVNYTESIIAGSPTSNPRVATPQDVFDNWMIDANVNPPKHRNAILGVGNLLGKARESGMGFEAGLSSPIPASTWVTNEYARTKLDKPFVLGTVYGDANNDDRYQAGEGQSGVPVTLTHDASGFTVSTTSKQAGGYAFEILIPGQFTVDINGQKKTLTVDAANLKVDSRDNAIVN